MAMAIRNWTTPITPCSASYQVGPLAGIVPASCNAEAGRRNTPKMKATRTSQKGHRTQHVSTDEPRSSSNHQPVRKEGQSRPAIRRLDTSLGRQACPFLGLFELERYDREDKTRLVEGAKAGKVTNVSDLALNEPPGLDRGTRDKHIWRIVPQLTKATRDELINDRLVRCAPQSFAAT